ncbi:hypothetical protein BDB01DRAFT_791018 [Pilobolus umbonatus]|nr:hypothetical protein BDB01DRAFT_791018 [Pilobolus umbonatus]
MSNSNEGSRLEDLLDLLKDKPKMTGDQDFEINFYNKTLEYLLSDKVDHWWCDESILPIAKESLWLFSLPNHESILRYKKKLAHILSRCNGCVREYHTSKEVVKREFEGSFPKEAVANFFELLNNFDLKRLQTTYQSHLSDSKPFHLSEEVICALLETVYSPSVLKNKECDDYLCQLFEKIQQSGLFPTFEPETAPYIVRLSLHHHRIIRFWSRKLLEKFINSDGYSISEEEFAIIQQLLCCILKRIEAEDDSGSERPSKRYKEAMKEITNECPFVLSADLGEFWKTFKIVCNALSPELLQRCISLSGIYMPELIKNQLSTNVDWLGELLKTMTTMLLKLQSNFWGTIGTDSSPYYDIIKDICDHSVFQMAMNIAREGNTGKVLQRDGSPYPDDKLMAKIKSMLEWIYPYWSSLRGSPVENDITKMILSTVFGYFQKSVWGIMTKAYCAELGLQIIDQCLEDNRISIDRINEYISNIVVFANITPSTLPVLVQRMPIAAREVIIEVVDRFTNGLHDTFGFLHQMEDSNKPDLTEYVSMWKHIRPSFDNDIKNTPWLVNLIFKAYSNVAMIDSPTLFVQKKSGKMSVEGKAIYTHIHEISGLVTKVLKEVASTDWDTRRNILNDPDMSKPILHLLISHQPAIKSAAITFVQKDAIENVDLDLVFSDFYYTEPMAVLEAANSVLREYNDLMNMKLDLFSMLPSITQFLYILIKILTNSSGGYLITLMDSKTAIDEDNLVGTLWDACWRAISITLDSCLKWAETYKPRSVIDAILPALDAGNLLIHGRHYFNEVASRSTLSEAEGQELLRFDSFIPLLNALSQWIYVNRTELLSKLIPLTLNLLDILRTKQTKITVEAFDAFMTAATGVNATKLSTEDKEALFTALSAHEPTNFIFLNDSDDEDVEWQSIAHIPTDTPSPQRSMPAVESKAPPKNTQKVRQVTLDQSFGYATTTSPLRPSTHKTNRITTYFGANSNTSVSTPTNISGTKIDTTDFFDDGNNQIDEADFFDDDIDYSQVPEEWFGDNKVQRKEPVSIVPYSDSSHKPKSKVPSVSDRFKKMQSNSAKANRTRVFPQTKQPTFAVTTTGRKLKPPSMGFSKMQGLKAEFRAERRLLATAKSPSAANVVRQSYGNYSDDNTSSGSSDEGEDDTTGLMGLVYDMDGGKDPYSSIVKSNVKAESASVKALFESKPRRTIKLLDTPGINTTPQKKVDAVEEYKKRLKIPPDISNLFKKIFSWDIMHQGELPPNVNESAYCRVPDTFSSFEEYRKTFEPLLIIETWTQVIRAKESLAESEVMSSCKLENRCHINDFVDISFSAPMSTISNSISLDDLVCIANHFGANFFKESAIGQDGSKLWNGKCFLGKVMSISQKRNMGEVVIRSYFPSDCILLLNSLSPKTAWDILRVMSLATVIREYSALQGLEQYDLANEILQPKASILPTPDTKTIEHYKHTYKVNNPQAKAIISAIEKKKGFSLIQGPPGTGKTKTILALIVSLLDHKSKHSKGERNHNKLLVCAPSNAAVDEIAKRLKDGIQTSSGIRKLNVVRVGVTDSVNASVKDIILDRLIENELDSTAGKNTSNPKWSLRRDHINDEMRNIQLELEDVEREIAQSGSDINVMSNFRSRRKTLKQKLDKCRTQLKDVYIDQKEYTKDLELSRIHARHRVFSNADVVCATLSGSGNEMLTSVGISFETVIVDEAAQSIEISSLIPLKFGTQRCILVGDPNQLPPTVLSMIASKYSYEQSLFMRLENSMANEVNLLSIQYRMHPEISSFPSKLFYQSRLLDGPNMDQISSAVWHTKPEFPPYCFYNVSDGQEMVGRGKSIYNAAEADAAVTLVDLLVSKFPTIKFASKVGIITPYKQQLSQLKNRFQRRFGSGILDVIDFNTVDGFQGQEKDIIIFSCVRAGQERGIGFLSDIRRMNVGLTRAKCSLFILGNADSLGRSEYWRDLVRDAKKRDLMFNCSYPYFRHRPSADNVPQNIFEKELVSSKKPVIQKKQVFKISIPAVNSSPESSSSEGDNDAASAKKRPLSSSHQDGSSAVPIDAEQSTRPTLKRRKSLIRDEDEQANNVEKAGSKSLPHMIFDEDTSLPKPKTNESTLAKDRSPSHPRTNEDRRSRNRFGDDRTTPVRRSNDRTSSKDRSSYRSRSKDEMPYRRFDENISTSRQRTDVNTSGGSWSLSRNRSSDSREFGESNSTVNQRTNDIVPYNDQSSRHFRNEEERPTQHRYSKGYSISQQQPDSVVGNYQSPGHRIRDSGISFDNRKLNNDVSESRKRMNMNAPNDDRPLHRRKLNDDNRRYEENNSHTKQSESASWPVHSIKSEPVSHQRYGRNNSTSQEQADTNVFGNQYLSSQRRSIDNSSSHRRFNSNDSWPVHHIKSEPVSHQIFESDNSTPQEHDNDNVFSIQNPSVQHRSNDSSSSHRRFDSNNSTTQLNEIDNRSIAEWPKNSNTVETQPRRDSASTDSSTAHIRWSGSETDNNNPNEDRFLQRIRELKERSTGHNYQQAPVSPNRQNLTLSAYRAARGLDPSSSGLNTQAPSFPSSRPQSSLFINKKRPVVKRQDSSSTRFSNENSARERVYEDHSRARENLSQIRSRERARDSRAESSSNQVQSLDSILDNVHYGNHRERN